MSTYTWPSGRTYAPLSFDMWLSGSDLTTRSVLGGGQQTTAVPGAWWNVAMTFPPASDADRHALIGLLRKLNGREHRMALWDMRKFGVSDAHGYPAGTIATSGVTAGGSAAQFASTLTLAGCGAGATLKPGDMWSVGGQLVENPALATANGSGVMTVLVPQRLRAAVASGAAVTLVQPTALFVLKDPVHSLRDATRYASSITVEFEEVFA